MTMRTDKDFLVSYYRDELRAKGLATQIYNVRLDNNPMNKRQSNLLQYT